jgi:hypothetical protein
VSHAQVSLIDLSTRGAEQVQRGQSPLSDVAAWGSNEAKARYEGTARVLRLHPLPKPVAIDLESARWFAFLDTLEARVVAGSVSSTQRSTLLSILDRARARQSSLRRPAVGVSSDGLLTASWSFIDMPGRVFSLEIQRDGAVDWFYRDAATDTSRGSEDELPHELPEEALLLLTAGFSMDPAGSR